MRPKRRLRSLLSVPGNDKRKLSRALTGRADAVIVADPGAGMRMSTGRYYDDFAIGDVYRSRLGRTVGESDNLLFTFLTLNTNQIHFNSEHARRSRFQRPLVNSTFTLALVTGLSVADTSENAIANLGWAEVSLPHPVFVGDTLWAESEVLEKRESRSKPTIGIVTIRSRGINQRNEVVIEFRRTFMIPKRVAAEVTFPGTEQPWTIA